MDRVQDSYITAPGTTHRSPAWPMARRLILLLPLLLLGAGCTTVDTRIALDASARANWTVLVLPFDDRNGTREVGDFTLYGWTATQGSSPIVSRAMAQALAGHEGLRVVPESAVRKAMWGQRITVQDAAQVDLDRACDLARCVGADMVVQGQVTACFSRWVLFIPYSRVSFEVRAYDARTQWHLWTATARKGRLYRSERQLAGDLAQRIAPRVAQAMLNVDSPPAPD